MNLKTLLKEVREIRKNKTKRKAKGFNNIRQYILTCLRFNTTAQSYGPGVETMVIKNCGLTKETDKDSGDARTPDGERLEIKFSAAGLNGQINFVQLRPHYNIDKYLLIYYDVELDKLETFLLCKQTVNEAIKDHGGGYAHGSVAKNGPITWKKITQENYEYCLRPNVKKQNSCIDFFPKNNLIDKEEYKWVKKLRI